MSNHRYTRFIEASKCYATHYKLDLNPKFFKTREAKLRVISFEKSKWTVKTVYI